MTMKNMTRGKLFLTSLLTVAVVVPLAANAHGKGRMGQSVSFEQLDANSDGQVTQAEITARAAARFQEADTDGDGFLSLEEVTAKAGERSSERAGKRVERMFERRDANADGKLSPDELAPPADRIAQRFERADADNNGSISKEEFDAVAKKFRGHRRGGDKAEN